MYYDQQEYDIRFEWGPTGLAELLPASDVVIIVDVLSFSTCVEVAVDRGAIIYPFRWNDARATTFALEIDAALAKGIDDGKGYALSPSSLLATPAGTRLVLPSPNGSTLSLQTGQVATLAGCLRNAQAIARAAQEMGPRVSVIAAGERWRHDGTLRPAIEDLIGAGAILAGIKGKRSPEAEVAEMAFQGSRGKLREIITACSSGKELLGRGRVQDVAIAAELNVSKSVPILVGGAYRLWEK
ncbi:MAG: hypothetical protein EXR62_16940 [Chloroflexi bacterium]|nr:hypothetical protein [Chloroflexota bacterium]